MDALYSVLYVWQAGRHFADLTLYTPQFTWCSVGQCYLHYVCIQILSLSLFNSYIIVVLKRALLCAIHLNSLLLSSKTTRRRVCTNDVPKSQKSQENVCNVKSWSNEKSRFSVSTEKRQSSYYSSSSQRKKESSLGEDVSR